jgi:hypothetical protein
MRLGLTACISAGWLLSSCLTGWPQPRGDVEAPLDRTLKKQFQQKDSAKIEAIPAQTVLFTNETTWITFWKKFGIAAPKIEFKTNAAFAVFWGEKPSSGYSVEVKKVLFQSERKKLRVEILELAPPANVSTLSVITYPFDVVAFAKPGQWDTLQIVRHREKRRK